MSDSSSRGIRQSLRRGVGVILAVGFAAIMPIALKYAGKGGTQVDPAELEKAHTTFGLVTVPLLLAIVAVVILFIIHVHTRYEIRD